MDIVDAKILPETTQQTRKKNVLEIQVIPYLLLSLIGISNPLLQSDQKIILLAMKSEEDKKTWLETMTRVTFHFLQHLNEPNVDKTSAKVEFPSKNRDCL